MKIMMKKTGDENWTPIDSRDYKLEKEWQDMIVENPSLIPVVDICQGSTALVLAIDQYWIPTAGQSDILAFSANGDIAIIECKHSYNPESRREVVAQILEYAAGLWGQTYETIDDRIRATMGQSLADMMLRRMQDEDWDEEAFRSGVRRTLEAGSFILVVAVDRTNDQLNSIIRFINGCSKPAFSLCAFEIELFQADDVEILVPHLYGQPEISAKPVVWSVDEFLASVKNDLSDHDEAVIRELLEFSESKADRNYHGSGKAGPTSFTFQANYKGQFFPIFAVQNSGYLQIRFDRMSVSLPEHAVRTLHRSLAAIPAFKSLSNDYTKQANIKVSEAFPQDSDSMRLFSEAILSMQDSLRSE